MAASIGEYAISVKADAREFQKGMEQVAVVTRQTALTIQQTTTQTTTLANGTRNTTFAIQQLAFGLQDAASVMGTAGFSGALRAASNNVIQFASLVNPLAGTIAAVGLTGIQVLADSFRNATSETEKATKALKDYTSWAKDAEKAANQFANVKKAEREDTASGARQTAESAREQTERDRRLIEESQNRIAELRRRSADVQARVAQRGGMLSAGTPTDKEQAEIAGNVEQIQALQAAITEARSREKENQEIQRAAIKREAELIEQEYGKVYQDLDNERAARQQEMIRKESEELVAKEKGRQELIAQSRRDEAQENERQAQKMRSVRPEFSYAGYGSAEATEALSRSRSTYADDAKNFQDKSIGIQENMLDQLVELNRQQKEANVDVVEDLLLGGVN